MTTNSRTRFDWRSDRQITLDRGEQTVRHTRFVFKLNSSFPSCSDDVGVQNLQMVFQQLFCYCLSFHRKIYCISLPHLCGRISGCGWTLTDRRWVPDYIVCVHKQEVITNIRGSVRNWYPNVKDPWTRYAVNDMPSHRSWWGVKSTPEQHQHHRLGMFAITFIRSQIKINIRALTMSSSSPTEWSNKSAVWPSFSYTGTLTH